MHRIGWEEVPAGVRAVIETMAGAGVMSVENQRGGFSPSLAARCSLDDGRTVFVKAVSPAQNPDSPAMLRHELRVSAGLPPGVPAPALLATYDDGDWVAGVWTFVDGRQPGDPWTGGDLDATFDALRRLAGALDPSPVADLPRWAEHGPNGWSQLALDPPEGLDGWSRRHLARLVEVESRWSEAVGGSALVHNDVRSDNLVIDGAGTVWFTDWANARIGAPWVDVVGLFPAAFLEGGPAPETGLARAAAGVLPGDPDPDAVTTYVVALAGYFTERSFQPPPPGIPHVRAFQAAQGEVSRRWVAARTGWR